MPTKKILNGTHDDYDAELWADYAALYAGGKKFFERIDRFLLANPEEPDAVYSRRKREANYRCYLGGIVDYFASYLFASPLVIRAARDGKPAANLDDFYAKFKEDCDGKDNDLHVFLRGRVIEAMQKRCAWWIVEKPQAPTDTAVMSRAEWAKLGLGRLNIRPLNAEQVLDWETDENGQMMWAIVYSRKTRRPSPFVPRDEVVERWDIYDPENVTRFELVYPEARPPASDVDVPQVAKWAHGFSRIPLVCLDVEESLWVANRVASPQKEHFRLSSAQGWSIRRTCYAMPVFNVEDDSKPPRMGVGYYMMIGLQEKMEWSAPPATPLEQIRAAVKDEKDEIFRIVHQMSLGVDNNAAAIGRSGKSKEVDADAVRVVLGALGKLTREAVERTYSLVSEGRGEEDIDWSIEGLDVVEEVDLDGLVAAVLGIVTLNIPSPTLKREMFTRVALASVPDADQAKKDDIREEIQKNVTDESVLNPPMPPDPDDDGDGGANPDAEPPVKAVAAPKAPTTTGKMTA